MADTPTRCPTCRSADVSPYGLETQTARCAACGTIFRVREEARDLFHQNWSDAARGPSYTKRFWQRLAQLLGF